MKLKSYNILFRIFSILSDKTNGAPFFVKYKLLLGTLILGLISTSAQAQKKEVPADTIQPPIPVIANITCYMPTASYLHRLLLPDINVRAIVVDEQGEPLIGALVAPKIDKREAIYTNSEGEFNLKAKVDDVLVFSFLGYDSKEILASEIKDKMQIVLKEGQVELTCYIVVDREIKVPYNDDIYTSGAKPITKLPYHPYKAYIIRWRSQ